MKLIKQAQLSTSIGGFPFIENLNLSTIVDYSAPTILFGMYQNRDWETLTKLQSHVTIFWAGADSHSVRNVDLIKQKKCRNITCTIQTANKLRNQGLDCEILNVGRFFFSENSLFSPTIKQNKIYSYIPHRRQLYYNKPMVDSLNLGDELLVGDFSNGINQKDWENGKGLGYYSQCYLGLFLCTASGGGTGIIEMGLCGMKVITNVLTAPNTMPWKSKQDILDIIQSEKNTIGNKDANLADEVRGWLSPDTEFLKITT
jgi:hypothetical protein